MCLLGTNVVDLFDVVCFETDAFPLASSLDVGCGDSVAGSRAMASGILIDVALVSVDCSRDFLIAVISSYSTLGISLLPPRSPAIEAAIAV